MDTEKGAFYIYIYIFTHIYTCVQKEIERLNKVSLSLSAMGLHSVSSE